MRNTRSAPRINLNLKIVSKIDKNLKQKFTLATGNVVEAQAFDISVVGIGIFVKYFLPKGLTIRLEIDGSTFGLKDPMKIEGVICHCKYLDRNKYKCGIKFTKLTPKYKDAIANFISDYEKRKNSRFKLP